MFELINLLETVYRTISADLEAWFQQFPEGLAWNVFSDYRIGDPSKANDTFAFAIVLNHDTQANIAEYIAGVAPSDIKGSRSSSEGLIAYLSCPVVFSISYLVEKKSKLLRDYMTDDNIRGALDDMREVVSQMAAMIPEKADHYRAVDKRLASFQTEMKRRSRNSNLARQILLCAALHRLSVVIWQSKRSRSSSAGSAIGTPCSTSTIRWLSTSPFSTSIFTG
ncbi:MULTISPECIES: hypothetical protein [Rhizobium]|uniref:Uncharacterized protein n=1 Tax=Rhizobium etli TaxID=29449 RepID=A0A7W6VFE6_RHIET|nr:MULTISPECIES: hypothetical protein [Rhizobium]ARQ60504.1 hypothetical protein Kim5_PA00026 [Rhizobium sp. Kim5]MBB4483216.1 hypothetical protein [Rhizobium etli]MBB4539044.1 hypothetical protein [Rhizobium etli]PDT07437.1 hypothetical protein CO655_26940 [Rhizobium sp. M1]